MTTRTASGRGPRSRRDRSDGDPTLAAYITGIADTMPLSTADEATLAIRIHAGDDEARNQLVEANLRFVITVAKEYHGRGLALSELISAGNYGLLIAAERFDETRGFRFISYAVWWVRQSILQALQEQAAVRLPASRMDVCSRVGRTYERLQQTWGPTSPQQVAEALGCTAETVEQALLDGQTARSLDSPLEDADSSCLLDLLADAGQPSPEEALLGVSVREEVAQVLAALRDREAAVVRLYFGLDGEPPLTLDQIGSRLSLTRERVRQIKEGALAKLRHPRLGSRLRSLVEP
jgi:RNA polymerase primary sigma factor